MAALQFSRSLAAVRRAEAPVAVLFGWVGAEARHLHKYCQLWNGLGVDTLALTVPTPVVFGQRDARGVAPGEPG